MPNFQRSNIFKMLNNEVSEERKIDSFPKPYNLECTPYRKLDFFDTTYKRCSEEKRYSKPSWLKLGKVIIIGDTSVGKTSIVNRFCKKIFDSNYKSTIGVDFEVERFEVLGVAYNLQIWDTAGQERFKSITQSYYRAAHAIVIVFDLTDMNSLDHCEAWLQEALIASASTCPYIFLVGSKQDLLKKYAFKNMEINAARVATKLNAEFWPVSSKTGKNIDRVFYRIVALTFDNFIIKEQDGARSKVEIGKSLIAFKKKCPEPNSKISCDGLQCSK